MENESARGECRSVGVGRQNVALGICCCGNRCSRYRLTLCDEAMPQPAASMVDEGSGVQEEESQWPEGDEG